jgi:L-amino acid N-acyltransferase YncA/protein-tyrosine-phosphatase
MVAPALYQGAFMTPEVLFVCVHNAGRSQMAAALLAHHGGNRVRVRSAGSMPADQVNPAVVQAMAEWGVDLSAEIPTKLSDEAVEASDVVVTMGCGDACPAYPGKRYLNWELPDPAGRTVTEIRPIRDDIDTRVRALLAELEGSSAVEVNIRPMVDADAAAVLAIYAAGIQTGNATFETETPDWRRFCADKLAEHRLVATDTQSGEVLGWAALSPVSDRCAYAGVAENAVYVHPAARGRGIGRALLRALVTGADAAGIWTVQTGIFPENAASVALHEKVGFRVVGRRERLGRHRGVWRDVLLLERRSPLVQ